MKDPKQKFVENGNAAIEGYTVSSFESAKQCPPQLAHDFEWILLITVTYDSNVYDIPAFRFAATSAAKNSVPDYGYFFPNYIGACPAIRVSIKENDAHETMLKLSAEACIIDVATVESFEIQLMVPPFTSRKTWTRDTLFKATSRLAVEEAKDRGDCLSFGDCEPLDDEQAKRMFILLNHYDWVHSKPAYEWQAERLKEVGFNISQRNVKKLIDSMNIAVLKDGKQATVAEARSAFPNPEMHSKTSYYDHACCWEIAPWHL